MSPRSRGRMVDVLDGALVIDKPTGPTSHDIVARVRRLSGGIRVGHTGTLDPFATGVLPLLLGRATRLARFLTADRKAYAATLHLGVTTSTDDLDGDVLSRTTSPLPDGDAVRAALDRFRGPIDQTPPVFSAKKVGGQPAYALARRQEPVQLAPVRVATYRLAVTEFDGARVTLDLECSSGFYVRALARDVGLVLGCGAHLTALRRVRSGVFVETQAVPVQALDEAPPEHWPLVPMASLLTGLPGAHLSGAAVDQVTHGNPVAAAAVLGWEPGAATSADEESPATGTSDWRPVRLLGPGGRLVAVARQSLAGPEAELLQPFVVLV